MTYISILSTQKTLNSVSAISKLYPGVERSKMWKNTSCLQGAWGVVTAQTETLTLLLPVTTTFLESQEFRARPSNLDWQGWLSWGDKIQEHLPFRLNARQIVDVNWLRKVPTNILLLFILQGPCLQVFGIVLLYLCFSWNQKRNSFSLIAHKNLNLQTFNFLIDHFKKVQIHATLLLNLLFSKEFGLYLIYLEYFCPLKSFGTSLVRWFWFSCYLIVSYPTHPDHSLPSLLSFLSS